MVKFNVLKNDPGFLRWHKVYYRFRCQNQTSYKVTFNLKSFRKRINEDEHGKTEDENFAFDEVSQEWIYEITWAVGIGSLRQFTLGFLCEDVLRIEGEQIDLYFSFPNELMKMLFDPQHQLISLKHHRDKEIITLVSNENRQVLMENHDKWQVQLYGMQGEKSNTVDIVLNICDNNNFVNANWMERCFSDSEKSGKRLNQIFIPGTHDSGTYNINDESKWAEPELNSSSEKEKLLDVVKGIKEVRNFNILGFKPFEIAGGETDSIVQHIGVLGARAQNKSIREQLLDGIRFFDLRPCVNKLDSKTEIWISHSLYSIRLNEVLISIVDFLGEFEKEIVILDFRYGYGFENRSEIEILYRILQQTGLTDKIYCSNDLTVPTISDLWCNKRNIILFAEEGLLKKIAEYENDKGIEQSIVMGNSWNDLAIAGDEAKEAVAESRIQKIDEDIRAKLSREENKLRLVKCEITPDLERITQRLFKGSDSADFDQLSLSLLAAKSNQMMIPKIKNDWSNNEDLGFIFTFDHYDNCELTSAIIELNDR